MTPALIGIALALTASTLVLAVFRYGARIDDNLADTGGDDDLMAVADACRELPSPWSERDVQWMQAVGVKP